MLVTDLTPALMIRNEEYWIHYVLKDLLQVFPRIIVLDTGSTDDTKRIIRDTATVINCGKLELIEENYGSDASLIGNGRNILRALVDTKWMFLVDGDEIWTKPQLENLLAYDIPDGKQVVMAGNMNIEDINGQLKVRTHDMAGKDILFTKDVKWSRVDYPFEGYGLGNTLSMDKVQYLPCDKVFAYHMRHTQRSSQAAFFRDEKYNYFPYDKGWHNLPDGWYGDTFEVAHSNPYVL